MPEPLSVIVGGAVYQGQVPLDQLFAAVAVPVGSLQRQYWASGRRVRGPLCRAPSMLVEPFALKSYRFVQLCSLVSLGPASRRIPECLAVTIAS